MYCPIKSPQNLFWRNKETIVVIHNDSENVCGFWATTEYPSRQLLCRVKPGEFGHQVNSDTHLQAVETQMRRLLMSRVIRIFIVCLVNLFFIPIIEL